MLRIRQMTWKPYARPMDGAQPFAFLQKFDTGGHHCSIHRGAVELASSRGIAPFRH